MGPQPHWKKCTPGSTKLRVNKIWTEYPAPDGIYVGYKKGEAVNEVDMSWALNEEDIG